jgi:hypothetical protein
VISNQVGTAAPTEVARFDSGGSVGYASGAPARESNTVGPALYANGVYSKSTINGNSVYIIGSGGSLNFATGNDIYNASPEVSIKQTSNGSANFLFTATQAIFSGGTIATNGVASCGTNQTLSVASTGVTNTLAVNYTVFLTAATGLSMSNNAGVAVFTGQTVAALTPITLQPGGKLVGTAITSAGGNAW